MQAYRLLNSRDLLQKLHWEINNMFFRQRYDVAACAYHTFNTAVTAWHISEWLWLDIQERQLIRDAICKQLAFHKPSFDAFRKYATTQSIELKLCRRIASGLEHGGVKLGTSTFISNGKGIDYGNPIIFDGEKERDASDVFYRAMFWYQGFIRLWDIFPEDPFAPNGDRDSPEVYERVRPKLRRIEP